MPARVARPPYPHVFPELAGICQELLGQRCPERPAASVTPSVRADENIDGLVGTERLVQDRQRRGNDFDRIDHKLGPLESCTSVGRPPVGDDMARPARQNRHQSLKAHPGASYECHHRCKRRILAQVPRPGKWPFDEQVAPITAGRADRIDMLLASPRRAKQPGTGINRVLRSDAGGHWRDLTGPRTAAHRSASTASEPDLPSTIARRAPSPREANVTRYIEVPATEHVMGGNADGDQRPGPASPTSRDATTTSTISSSQTAPSSRPRVGTTRPSRSWRRHSARRRPGQAPEPPAPATRLL